MGEWGKLHPEQGDAAVLQGGGPEIPLEHVCPACLKVGAPSAPSSLHFSPPACSATPRRQPKGSYRWP